MLLMIMLASTIASAAQKEVLHTVKEQLSSVLSDYPSARFKDVHIGKDFACGFINSKNQYGGYTGWKEFNYIRLRGEDYLKINDGDEYYEGMQWGRTLCLNQKWTSKDIDFSRQLKSTGH